MKKKSYIITLIFTSLATLIIGLGAGLVWNNYTQSSSNVVFDNHSAMVRVNKSYPSFKFLNKQNEKRASQLDNVIGNAFYAVDEKTGVEYIVTNHGGITPRYNKQGQIMKVDMKK